jgi:TonB family protein
MGLFASLLLNAVVAATPATPLPWYTFEDYPMQAFERQWKGAATFELLVGPNGRPANCTVTQSTGYAALDRQTCFIAMHRARFTPARGPDGAPAYGTYRSMVNWHRPDQDSLQVEPGPDLQVGLSALPPGTKKPAAVKLAYYVDAQGQPSSCTALPDSRTQPAALVDAACAQAFAKLAGAPNASGERTPTVKTVAVLFTVAD